jgi:hypothetical protein
VYRCCLEDLFRLSAALRRVDVVGRRGGVQFAEKVGRVKLIPPRSSTIIPKKNKKELSNEICYW